MFGIGIVVVELADLLLREAYGLCYGLIAYVIWSSKPVLMRTRGTARGDAGRTRGGAQRLNGARGRQNSHFAALPLLYREVFHTVSSQTRNLDFRRV